MPPKHYVHPRGANNTNNNDTNTNNSQLAGHNKENGGRHPYGGGGSVGKGKPSSPHVNTPTNTAGSAPQQSHATPDLTSSSPDELQAQMNRLLSEVDRVRSALEQQRKTSSSPPAGTTNTNTLDDEDEDEEVLRLQYNNSNASASFDEDQLQPQPLKKSRGFSPTTTNAVAKAFGQAQPIDTNSSDKRGGGSPLMDQQAWLQKMLKQMPSSPNTAATAGGGVLPQSAPSAPSGGANGPRSFQTPPPLPNTHSSITKPNPHDISALSSVPDGSVLSEQDHPNHGMWAPPINMNGDGPHGGMWQHNPHHHHHQPHHQQHQPFNNLNRGGRGGGGGAIYTNPHRTGAMSYRQNHHHDSLGERTRGGGLGGGRGGGFGGQQVGVVGGGGGLFSDDRYSTTNEYMSTKDYVVVEFKRDRTKKYPCAIKVQPGEYVIVDGDRGQDCGLVIQVAFAKDDGTFEVQCIDAMLKNYVRTKPERARVLRVATPEEVAFLHADIDSMEKAALQTCKAKCDELGITDLKLVDCEFQFDRQKVSFFFDSERSIDFRALVRDLHRAFGIRIWMENINPGVKNSVPADAQADIMWTGEDTAQQRLLGGMGTGAGGSTMMMMSAGPMTNVPPPLHHHQPNGGIGGFRGGRGGGVGRGAMRR